MFNKSDLFIVNSELYSATLNHRACKKPINTWDQVFDGASYLKECTAWHLKVGTNTCEFHFQNVNAHYWLHLTRHLHKSWSHVYITCINTHFFLHSCDYSKGLFKEERLKANHDKWSSRMLNKYIEMIKNNKL